MPIAYFLDRPFQNWSRRRQQLMMPVYIYTDYRVDVEGIREEFRKVLESSPDWDQSFQPILQVTGCDNGVLELRGLCGAASPGATWNLQCLVRERLIAYLRSLMAASTCPERGSRLLVIQTPGKAGAPCGKPPR